MMIWLKILGLKKERMIYMMIWLKILGSKKREDDLYDDLIEDLGIKNDKNIFFSYLSLWLWDSYKASHV